MSSVMCTVLYSRLEYSTVRYTSQRTRPSDLLLLSVVVVVVHPSDLLSRDVV